MKTPNTNNPLLSNFLTILTQPAQTTQTLTGAGTYLISLDTGITCLKFTIEEYN
jgi:hypothetical protein